MREDWRHRGGATQPWGKTVSENLVRSFRGTLGTYHAEIHLLRVRIGEEHLADAEDGVLRWGTGRWEMKKRGQ